MKIEYLSLSMLAKWNLAHESLSQGYQVCSHANLCKFRGRGLRNLKWAYETEKLNISEMSEARAFKFNMW